MRNSFVRRIARCSVALGVAVLTTGLLAAPVSAETVTVREDAPDRYTVREGDTLWGIAEQFLSDPWRWPAIWKVNDQIENPHLIFPGDVMVMGFDANGDPSLKVLRNQRFTGKTVKLSPGIYVDPLSKAIPTIAPNVIQPFLSTPLVVDMEGMHEDGHVTEGVEENIIIGNLQQFYAREVSKSDTEVYQIYRPGKKLIDPLDKELLGWEAIYVADARMLRHDEDVSKLEVINSKEEVSPGDRLRPAPDVDTLPYYFPTPPSTDVEGLILNAYNGVSEIGTYSIVALNLGEREGMVTGNVLRIMRHGSEKMDPVTKRKYTTPREDSGLVMVFRVFEKVSYGLVMKATRAVHVNDYVVTP